MPLSRPEREDDPHADAATETSPTLADRLFPRTHPDPPPAVDASRWEVVAPGAAEGETEGAHLTDPSPGTVPDAAADPADEPATDLTTDPATSAWHERLGRRRARRSRRQQLGLIIGGVVVANLALALAIPPLLPFLVFRRSEAATAPPAPAPAPRPPAALPGSPADTVLTQVAADPALLPSGWSRVSGASAAYGSPYPRACPSALPSSATGVGSRFVSARQPRSTTGSVVAAGISVTALPAGQSALAVDQLRTWVAACPGGDGVDPSVVDGQGVSGLDGADAFVARGGADPSVTWVVWARGDLLVAASVSGLGASPSSAWPAVVGAVDATVQRHLEPVCADLAPTAADARRNPTLPTYAPWAPTQSIAVPAAVVQPDPAPVKLPVVTLPEPVPHPDLAPVVVPDRAAWVDTDGDGVGDTPPPVTDAPRGEVPVFRDATAIVAPDGLVTTAPVEPTRPAVPPSSLSVAVPAVDKTGPGCGWAFSGGAAPAFDEASTAAEASRAKEAALSSAAAAADAFATQQAAWKPAEESYLDQLASYTTWSRYDTARTEALAQQAAAQSAYDASLVAYEAAVAAVAAVPTTPPTTPTSTPPTTPTSTAPSGDGAGTGAGADQPPPGAAQVPGAALGTTAVG